LRVNVEQAGPAGVRYVGCVHRSGRQTPQQEAIDCPAGELPALRSLPSTGNVIEYPGDLGRGKVWIEKQAGTFPNQRFGALLTQPCALFRCSAILPHYGSVDRFAGCAVPDDHRLTLVGDTECGDALGSVSGSEHLACDCNCALPDLLGVMLDPARCRIVLSQLKSSAGDRTSLGIKQNRPCRGRSLVDRQNAVGCYHPSEHMMEQFAREGVPMPMPAPYPRPK
jgi:hypothetical protein